ncbi:1-phosphatidylinositol 4,5-bisphosphate phosphodiesterase gamma-2 [Arapaima gigas]
MASTHEAKSERSFFVETEVLGLHFKTRVCNKGSNPVWPAPVTPVKFLVYEPELTFLRFVVNEEDMFSDTNFHAQATFPVKGICSGRHQQPLAAVLLGSRSREEHLLSIQPLRMLPR